MDVLSQKKQRIRFTWVSKMSFILLKKYTLFILSIFKQVQNAYN